MITIKPPAAPQIVATVSLTGNQTPITAIVIGASISGSFTLRLSANTNCLILFGPDSGVQNTLVTVGWPVPANVVNEFTVSNTCKYFSVKDFGVAGTVYFYIPGQAA